MSVREIPYQVVAHAFNLDEVLRMIEVSYPDTHSFSKRYIISNIKQAKSRLDAAQKLIEKWRNIDLPLESNEAYRDGIILANSYCATELERVLGVDKKSETQTQEV